MIPPLIHIGYPKTATSWLQKEFFANDSSIFISLFSHSEIDALIARPHSFSFTPSKVVSEYDTKMKQFSGDKKIPVISSEILVGNPFHGHCLMEENSHRLKACFPDAKILVTIRKQSDIYESLYKQYVRRGGCLRPETFFLGNPAYGYAGFEHTPYKYDKLYRALTQLFGEKNVLFLCYEEFISNPATFLKKIFHYIDQPTPNNLKDFDVHLIKGRSAPNYILPLLRSYNYFRGGAVNPKDESLFTSIFCFLYKYTEKISNKFSIQGADSLKDICKNVTSGRFTESNTSLQNGPLPELKSLGYDCE